MIITKLVVHDFGQFAGTHEFLLRPHDQQGHSSPIVLFGGKNGVGKTTLLDAIRLCLYGRDALGFRIHANEYQEQMRRRLHQSSHHSAHRMYVGLEFEFIQDSVATLYYIVRTWEATKHGIEEELALYENGAPKFGLHSDHWQDMLKDLIPIGLANLFFFDGERIQTLADDEQGDDALGDAIKELLGIKVIEQLESDMNVYRTRLAKSENAEQTNIRRLQIEQEKTKKEELLQHLKQDKSSIQNSIDRVKKHIRETENLITRRGGNFSKTREQSFLRKQALQESIKQVRNQIEEACGNLLPFALAPKLMRQVYHQIQQDAEYEAQNATTLTLTKHIELLKQYLIEQEFWQNIGSSLSESTKEHIAESIAESVPKFSESLVPQNEASVLHALSARDRQKLSHWIIEALSDERVNARQQISKLISYQDEIEQLDHELQAAPPSEIIAPLLEQLRILHTEAAVHRQNFERLSQDEDRLRLEIGGLTREIAKIDEIMREETQHTEKGLLAAKTLATLNEFRVQLLRSRIADLEVSFTEYFNRLAHKQELVSHVIINEQDFSMTLIGRDGKYLSKSRLSAGEKQIYAIALLWALRAVAGRPLPIIIDTPLGRLDSDHRKNLVEEYFPYASHQVIIFSTDTEIDAPFFADLTPSMSHAYHLNYDEKTGSTVEELGYFWLSSAEVSGAS